MRIKWTTGHYKGYPPWVHVSSIEESPGASGGFVHGSRLMTGNIAEGSHSCLAHQHENRRISQSQEQAFWQVFAIGNSSAYPVFSEMFRHQRQKVRRQPRDQTPTQMFLHRFAANSRRRFAVEPSRHPATCYQDQPLSPLYCHRIMDHRFSVSYNNNRFVFVCYQ